MTGAPISIGWSASTPTRDEEGDGDIVPRGVGFLLGWATQRGQLQGYALGMMLGVAVILVWVFA